MKQTTGRTIEHGGRSLTIEGWARELGVTPTAVRARIGRGWTEVEAVSTPQGEVPARITAEREAKPAAPKAKPSEKPSAKPTRAPKRARKTTLVVSKHADWERAPSPLVTAGDVAAIASALDPVELLTRLGYPSEHVGVTPAGLLVLVRTGHV
jgi:hypothetical protein